MLILVATTVSATLSLVNATLANTKLRKEIKTIKLIIMLLKLYLKK